MTWQPLLPDGYGGAIGAPPDLGELVSLIERVDTDVQGSTTITLDTVSTMLGDPHLDPANDVAVIRTAEGALVGAAMYEQRSPYVHSMTNGWVDPAHVGQGIGSALVAWARNRAESRIRRAPDEARVTMAFGTNDRNERAKRLFTREGFSIERYFLEMEVVLDTPVKASAKPEGVTVRTMRPEESVDDLSEAVTSAFRDHFGFTERPAEENAARWRQWRTSEMWDDDLVWLAEEGDRIVGVNVSLRFNGAKKDQGYVASLGVLPGWRGRGLARNLLTTSFSEYQRRGMTSVSLHVDADSITGATRLYTGVGMKEVEREVDYELELRPGKDLMRR